MRTILFLGSILAGILVLAACGSTPTEVTPITTSESPAPILTPAGAVVTSVAGAVATPASTGLTLTVPALVTPVRVSPSPSPTPGTPTATPTPAPSDALIREAAALQEKFDAFQVAVASGDKDSVLKAQRELLDELPKAEAAAANDPSKAAEAFRVALRALRAASGGDLAKLEGVAKGIEAVTGEQIASRATTTSSTSTTARPITNLSQYARDLAGTVAAFQKAQDSGNVADLLRLQQSLLSEIDRGQAALKNARGKQVDLVRGALEDLGNALAGDPVKFAAAQAKLTQAAGSGDTSSKATPTTTKSIDVQPVANDLMNKLDSYQHAVDGKNEDEIAKAQQALTDQIAKAKAAIKDDNSTRAAKLRDALGAVAEAAAGDQVKLDAARSALDSVMSAE